MTTRPKAARKPPQKRKAPPPDAVLPEEGSDKTEPQSVSSPVKANWSGRILYAVLIGYVIWSMTHHKVAPVPTPEPAPASGLVAEIAPLFPPDQNDTASLYAAYFTAQADKAAKDGKPVPQSVFKRARESMGLADNPELAVIVNREFQPFTLLKGDWQPDQVNAYVETQRSLAEACLAASVD